MQETRARTALRRQVVQPRADDEVEEPVSVDVAQRSEARAEARAALLIGCGDALQGLPDERAGDVHVVDDLGVCAGSVGADRADEDLIARVARHVADARRRGAELPTGGRRRVAQQREVSEPQPRQEVAVEEVAAALGEVRTRSD